MIRIIKKLQTIQNFGVFKDFNWNESKVKEFKEKNIIYGWNYSGKTTISRIFSSLKNREIHKKYSDAKFKLVYGDDNEVISQDEINDIDLQIQVFNAEYIKDNLKWDTSEELEGIAFDVGENVKTRKEIEKNNKRIERIKGTNQIPGKLDKFSPDIKLFNEFEVKRFSNEARRIKNDVFDSLIEYNKSHLKRTISLIENNIEQYKIINEDTLAKVKKTALAKNDKVKVDKIVFESNLKTLYQEIAKILKAEPSQSEIIEVLEKDNKLYIWSKEGLDLHNNKNECSFCGSTLTQRKLDELKRYFTNESAKLREQITECKGKLAREKEKIKDINLPRSKNDLTDKYQNEYKIQFDKFNKIKDEYILYLDLLIEELNRKEKSNIFKALEIIEYKDGLEKELNDWIEKTQNILNSHNLFVDNFTEEQSEAREKLKKHQVAKYLFEEKYFEKKEAKEKAERRMNKYQKLLNEIVERNNNLEAQLKSVVAGKDELNKFIQAFLNRADINIEVTRDDKFILKRGNITAENLSEGEKTAISFSYFLATLESLHRDGKLVETIIFIDDPISSLDANHISQVYSVLNSFFFRQNLNPEDPSQFVNCFKQLFISTHNFEFFSFLKDSPRLKKNKGENRKEYYYIKRIDEKNSEIQQLPKTIEQYKSEYIYLFDLIFSYYEKGCQENDQNLILLPNAVRRFLEIYTLTKIPDSTGEVDSRLNELLGEPNQLKTLHYFSHFTSFEKIRKHDEMILNLPEAVKELFHLLEKDEKHLESLKRAVR